MDPGPRDHAIADGQGDELAAGREELPHECGLDGDPSLVGKLDREGEEGHRHCY